METKFYKRIFISPGIVSYKDDNDGVLLLQKETIDNALDTLKNKPIIITHNGTEQVGEIVDCYYSPEKGGYVAGMNIWDKQAQDLLDNKEYSISCTYNIDEVGDGGIYHNINYDEEAKAITFKNIAIVQNPRYNEAREKLNSINNNEEKTMKFFKKNEIENKKEVCNADEDFVIFRGQKLPLEEFGRVLLEEVAFHKDEPVDEKSETIEDETIENEEVDKRKEIDDVGGFLKSKGLNDEDIRYVMKLMEQASYNKSEADTKDNEVKDEKEIKKVQEKTGEKELEKKAIKPIENSIKEKRNSIVEGFKTRAERIAESNKSFYC